MIWGYHYFRKHPFTGVKKNPVSYFKGPLDMTKLDWLSDPLTPKKPRTWPGPRRKYPTGLGGGPEGRISSCEKRHLSAMLKVSKSPPKAAKTQNCSSNIFTIYLLAFLESSIRTGFAKFTIGDFQINIVSIYTDLRSPKS